MYEILVSRVTPAVHGNTDVQELNFLAYYLAKIIGLHHSCVSVYGLFPPQGILTSSFFPGFTQLRWFPVFRGKVSLAGLCTQIEVSIVLIGLFSMQEHLRILIEMMVSILVVVICNSMALTADYSESIEL